MEENKKENANINDNENIISKTTVDNVENITDNISKDGQVKKQKIIPSYAKKSEDVVKDKKKNNVRRKSKISIFILLVISIVILLAIIYGIYFLINYNENKKYKEYEKSMSAWGFSEMYNNKKASFYEDVSKSEAVKMIISASLNISDISKRMKIEETNYENEPWIKYGENLGIISENNINTKNQDDKITLIEFLEILSNAKVKLIEKNLDSDAEYNYAFLDKVTNDQKIILKDMIYNKILEDVIDNTNVNKKLSKGMCNKLLYNFVKKYNTITINGAKLNINEEKLPSNVEDYPYILSNIDKSIYQKRFKYQNVSKFKKPVEIYSDVKEYFETIDMLVSEYVSTVFNINYTNLNENELKERLKNIYGISYNEYKINKYIEQIKTNKIIITGTAIPQYPIVYFDGNEYRVRVKIVYSIQSSTDLKNIFFLDNNEDITYSFDSTEGLYDIAFRIDDENQLLYICPMSISNFKIS